MVTGITLIPEDVVITPSQGNVRAVRTGPKTIAFQDPDLVIQRTLPDGRVIQIRNLFISREPAIDRLKYDFDRNRIVDTFGTTVGTKHIGLPTAGRVVDYKTLTATWSPLTTDPRKYIPAANEEVVERVVFMNREGKLVTEHTSYGLGRKYDRSKTGWWWAGKAKEALGIEPGEKVTTKELQRAVVHREFVVKRLTPRS